MRPVILLTLLLAGVGCGSTPPPGSAKTPGSAKIGFDLDTLDADGLYGDEGGKRALSYEFCIPDDPAALDEVRSIDPTAEAQTSPGRIGCGEDQLLVIGSTHQRGWREVLAELAARPDIERIEQAWFE